MKFVINLLALLLLVSALLTPAAHAGPAALNLDAQGVAIQGYDPVAFFTVGKPVAGTAEFSKEFNGATYRFASAAHQAAFEREPARYAPQFGGYCGYGVAQGYLAPIKVDAFQIVDGRLILQYDRKVRDLFNEDQAGNLKQADQQWPEVAAKGKKP